MNNINLIINGQPCTGQATDTILDIAAANGIEIPTLCFHESVRRYGACGLCVVEAEGNTKLLRACSTQAVDGMVIHTETERVRQSRKIALELLLSDHVGDCLGPCKLACPAGTDCQGYVKQIALGNDYEAVKLIKEKIPLPASIGRICPHPCEKDCRRALVEEPISIAYLKSFAADNDLASATPYQPEIAASSGKSVAVVGGGPAGLSAAYFLAVAGHQVTILEAMPRMGGMLRYGIPEYRLPKLVLDGEIAQIAALGVKLRNNVRVGRDITLSQLRQDYDAVLVAIGAWKSSGVGCDGEDLRGVMGGIDFLRETALGKPPQIGDRVAVVGGGNTAMDACRTAVRLGAREVYIVYRRTEAEMPAEPLEIQEAKEEGVIFRFLAAPAELLGEQGQVRQMKLQMMRLGEPDAGGRRAPVPIEGAFEMLNVDSVIAAIGQKVDVSGFEELELNRRGIIAADERSFRTNLPAVFAVGDATNSGADIAIAAIGEANKAAAVIDAFLKGVDAPYQPPFVSKAEPDLAALAAREKLPRAHMPHRGAQERKCDFTEINFGFSEEQARKEAARCLECGCHDYGDCSLIRYANRYPLAPERFQGEKHSTHRDEVLVTIKRDMGKCILCNLCVRVCEEVAQKGILGLVGRGFTTVVKPEFENQETISICRDCQKCVEACVTGALQLFDAGADKEYRFWLAEDGVLGAEGLNRLEEDIRRCEDSINTTYNEHLLAQARLQVAREDGGSAGLSDTAAQEAQTARDVHQEALSQAIRLAYDLQRKYGRAMNSCQNELAAADEQLDSYQPQTPQYEDMEQRISQLSEKLRLSTDYYHRTHQITEDWQRRLHSFQQEQ